jgi:hypothetical protein
LRFSRDKRGYENTFVVHTGRRRGKSRSRILYWFRTPPGVRIGRAALDEDAIRLIEQHNPDVEFDWTRILKGQGAPVPEAKSVPPRDAYARPPRSSAPAMPQSNRNVDSPPRPAAQPVLAELTKESSELAKENSESDPGTGVQVQAQAQDVLEIPAVPIDETPTAAGARLGSEGLLRLRARYAEVLARISERITEPSRQEQLKTEAERLNPDIWVTDAEVTAGLEQYEQVFESLRAVVGRQRKRRREKRAQGSEGQPAASENAVVPEEEAGAEPESTEDM